jgi:pimeloyl-ACP methyl ester carboxylesterase
MAELNLDGVRVAYEERGAGRPGFLFVHGWACDRSCWAAQMEVFSDEYRCVAVDLRGRGESSPVPPFGVGQQLEDLAGLSLGGITALALNGRYPELVLALVTIDSPITAETGAGSPRSVERIREGGSMRAVEGFLNTFHYDPPHTGAAAYIEQTMFACPADVGAGMLEDLHLVGEDMKRLLREADKKPFMMIWAEKPLGDPAWIREQTMFVRQEPVAESGHFVHMEQPDVTNALLTAFLDDIARDPRVTPI